SLAEYRWHDWDINDVALGPADRVTSRSVAGTTGATSRLPDQDAQTVTWTTASRRHWGRVYLPGIGFNRIDNTTGRWASTQVDAAALHFHTLATSLVAGGYDMVVVSRQFHALLTIDTISVDDIVDIQRRRRAKQASYHKIYTS